MWLIVIWFIFFLFILVKGKCKVFYGEEPPSLESATTECGVNYQLLAVISEVAQWETPGCSRPQPAPDNGARDGRSNWLVAPPPSWAVPPEFHVLHRVNAAYKSQDLLQQLGLVHAFTGMPNQRTTCAATQGIKQQIFNKNNVFYIRYLYRGIHVVLYRGMDVVLSSIRVPLFFQCRALTLHRKIMGKKLSKSASISCVNFQLERAGCQYM